VNTRLLWSFNAFRARLFYKDVAARKLKVNDIESMVAEPRYIFLETEYWVLTIAYPR
jgi:hypothetical protein